MKYSGIIFDFNGTLFWDSEKHVDAWRFYSKKLRGYPLNIEEIQRIVFGRTNKSIVEYLIGKTEDDEKIEEMVQEKEKIYRDICDCDKSNLKLAPGAVELLDFLVDNKIPHTIATGSEKVNVNYFFEIFNLKKWFDLDKIVFDDGLIPGKPDPDFFLIAAQKIGLRPEQCIVIEDSLSGIESARCANIGKIFAIGTDEKNRESMKNVEGVDYVISNFYEIDKDIFLV